MGEVIFKVCGIALLSAVLLSVLKRFGAESAVLLKIAAGVVAAAVCFVSLSPIIDFLRELSGIGGENAERWTEFMLRVLSIAVITHICSTVCKDCGETSLAGYIEIGGKVEIIILSLPYVREIIDTSVGLL